MKNGLDQTLNWLLIRASIPAKHAFMQLGEEHGLTIMQLFTLCLLEEGREVTMQAISATLCCDASNTTGIVERLVAGKFVERSEYPRDRRVKVLKLTLKGRTTRTLIMKELATTSSSVSTNLTHEEIAVLKALLVKAMANY